MAFLKKYVKKSNVIPSQCPMSLAWESVLQNVIRPCKRRIATPACALVRNDICFKVDLPIDNVGRWCYITHGITR